MHESLQQEIATFEVKLNIFSTINTAAFVAREQRENNIHTLLCVQMH